MGRPGQPTVAGPDVRWLVPRELQRLFRGIVSGLASEGRFFRVVDVIFLPLFLIPVTALVILAFIVFRILRAIPWKPLQDFAALKAIDTLPRRLVRRRADPAHRSGPGGQHPGASGGGDRGLPRRRVRHDCRGRALGRHDRRLHDARRRGLPVAARQHVHHARPGPHARMAPGARRRSRTPPTTTPTTCTSATGWSTDLSRLSYRSDLRWYDFWATHDPAPAGGFGTGPSATVPEATAAGPRRCSTG